LTVRAIATDEFDRLMSDLGPFEPAPHIAVGVSGGADSLALTLLLDDWLRRRGGALQALTVDHGLRPEAAAEAAQVARTLKARGIAHRTLRWHGPKPKANVQAAAREARYALLEDWCARRGILHLALAHHLDDQAETWMLRLARGSGLDGLAAMAPVAERPSLRLIRPLLNIPKARLEATVTGRGLTWIDDPTNRDPGHARVRMRALMPGLAAEGADAERLCATARHLGRARAALEAGVADLLVRAVRLSPAGFAWLDPRPLRAAPAEIGLRALARVLATVGGLAYPPRFERLESLYGQILGGLARGATLGGCRLVPRRGGVLIVREVRGVADCALKPGVQVFWDGRFEVAAGGGAQARGLSIGALGPAGWAEVRRLAPEVPTGGVPAPARASLPAIRDVRGLLAVPHLGYRRPAAGASSVPKCRFAPANGLTTRSFTVA
jgi:tRNA(Ile)-lysidine synthase